MSPDSSNSDVKLIALRGVIDAAVRYGASKQNSSPEMDLRIPDLPVSWGLIPTPELGIAVLTRIPVPDRKPCDVSYLDLKDIIDKSERSTKEIHANNIRHSNNLET